MRSHVGRVVVPYQRAAAGRPDGDAHTIDEQLVARVGREVQECRGRRRVEVKIASKGDDAGGRVLARERSVDPVGGPYPVGLEGVDGLDNVRRLEGPRRYLMGMHVRSVLPGTALSLDWIDDS